MNKPYTCHNCATVFDLYPDAMKEAFEAEGRELFPRIKVKCPGCADDAQGIYTVDTIAMQPISAE